MIHTVYYEQQGQRQRFEPREHQGNDLEQSSLHLSLSLHLDLDTRLRRARHTLIARVTTIFAAFMGALALALGPVWTQAQGVSPLPTLEALFGLAGHLVFAGALLGVGAVLTGGIPLVASAWRTSPRSRRLLLVPILASLPTIACALFFAIMMPLGIQRPPLILPAFLFYGGTVVSTIAIIRAIRQARIADTWLRWANHLSWLVVGGMVLMLIGVVCWGLALVLMAPGWFAVLIPWLPFPFGMLLAVMAALWASFWRVQPPASQPWPHDASPSEVASSGEPRGDRG
ncbi:hypothetical protein ccbrp13_17060 [Ktedonobacteria bacterium brp13]|nr:hypothetical protein ccbrp13_17060 [Ktedonobacteria bacterium brp13]